MTKLKTTTRSRFRGVVLPVCALLFIVGAGTRTASALNDDDFDRIVRHIESRYHAHRNYAFLMALAGMTVKVWQGSGVKDLKIAYFEDQPVLHSASDRELDELVQAVGNSGWQPLVKSISRRSGDHVYIYAKTEGKDLRMLIVNVEPSEAEVVQLKLDPRKLEEFLNDHTRHGLKRSGDLAFN